MPDIKSLTFAAPIREVLTFVRSDEFRSEVKDLALGHVSVRITLAHDDCFNAWIGITGEGSDVSVRARSLSAGQTEVTLWFGLKIVLISGCLLLPVFGLGLLVGLLAYLKKASKAKSLGARVGAVLTKHFPSVEQTLT
jgi:hypothetical protein